MCGFFKFSGKAVITNIFPREEGKDYIKVSLTAGFEKDEQGNVVNSGQNVIAICKGHIMKYLEVGKFSKGDLVIFEGTMKPNEEYLSKEGEIKKFTTYFINKMAIEAFYYPKGENDQEDLPNV